VQAVEQHLGAQQALEFGAVGCRGVGRGGLARLLGCRWGWLLGARSGVGGEWKGAGEHGEDEGSDKFLHFLHLQC